MIRAAATALLVLTLVFAAPVRADQITPVPGPARSIGGAANGCLAGAVALPLSGAGWETLRPSRNRFWGNPALVSLLEELAGRAQPYGRLLIADMAQPRGGPMPSGHGSHQTGVDADILFRLADGPLSEQDRMDPDLSGVVAPDGTIRAGRWTDTQTAIVQMFAADPRVERIFVNPSIKRALCRSVTGDREWLRTLRPWWGHDEHFHVRIKCPAGDRDCLPGPPLPPGDGCGSDLDWWFTADATTPKPAPPGGGARKIPPAACAAVLSGP